MSYRYQRLHIQSPFNKFNAFTQQLLQKHISIFVFSDGPIVLQNWAFYIKPFSNVFLP